MRMELADERQELSTARQHQQLFVMSILPEEDITGYVVRQSFDRSQGRVLMKPDTVAQSTSRPGWAFPSGLGALGSEIKIALPDIDTLIDRHTRFPLFSRFQAPEGANALREHHRGLAMKGVAAHVGMANKASRSRMAVCPDCMQTDIKEHGYTMWRRLHLTPGILACPTHQRPLLTFCDVCEAGHRRVRTNWRPTMRCVCSGSLKPLVKLDRTAQEMAIGVASMADQILRGVAPTEVTSASVTEALRHHLGNGGESSGPAHERLREALLLATGSKGLSSLGIGDLTLKRLVGSRRHDGLIRNPIQNLGAIHAVFGGFDGLTRALTASRDKTSHVFQLGATENVGGRQRKGNRRRTGEKYISWVNGLLPQQSAHLRMESRRWLLELMLKHPGIQRSELYDQPGSSAAMRFLKHVDQHWFDSTLPHSITHNSVLQCAHLA